MSADMNKLERQELILAVSRVVDEIRPMLGGGEPNWDPLHTVVPLEHCRGFMWMHRETWKGRTIEHYKHGITRRYLSLDHDGRAVVRRRRSFVNVPVERAVDNVFEGIEALGATRSTPYDEAYRLEKYRRLRDAGWTVVT
jgi:hypothetical protein